MGLSITARGPYVGPLVEYKSLTILRAVHAGHSRSPDGEGE